MGVPDRITDGLGKNLGRDYAAMMDFLCYEWGGKNGDLKGCMVRALQENWEAVNVFNFIGGGDFSNVNIEAAIRMIGVENQRETFLKVRILADEFLRERKK